MTIQGVSGQSISSATGSALILGISGQDGAYLAQLLLRKGYSVAGTTRSADRANLWRLEQLGIADQIEIHPLEDSTPEGLIVLIKKTCCTELYALSAQSSVGVSYGKPYETIQSIVQGAAVALEAVRRVGEDRCCEGQNDGVRLFIPSSSEIFGDNNGQPITEETPLAPCNPYAAARVAALTLAREYRERYGLHVGIGFLFNHESPLRGEQFVTQKIVRTARAIAEGTADILELGCVDISRDWGWAPEFVEAMWKTLQEPEPHEYIVATGKSYKLETFLESAFAYLGLDWRDYVHLNADFSRPTDHKIIQANPARIARNLNWKATVHTPEIARRMVQHLSEKKI